MMLMSKISVTATSGARTQKDTNGHNNFMHKLSKSETVNASKLN